MRSRITITFVTAVAVLLAACGSSSKTAGGAASTGTVGSAAGAATVKTASVSGEGTVLVDAQGRTLYVLTSEQGNNVTCTDSSGCASVWPPVVLPSGTTLAIAGSGVQDHLLGTVTASGRSRVTYGAYPLYTYSGDSGPGVANGKGIISFGGTWWPISPAGAPVTAASSSATTSGSGHPGGY